MSDILNKPPDSNNFQGELTERNILIHAINYLMNNHSGEWVFRMFDNIKDNQKRSYIESVLVESKLFEYNKNKTSGSFQLLPATRKRVTEVGIDKFFLETDTKAISEDYIKKLIKKELELTVEKLNDQIASAPNVEVREKSNVTMNIILAIASVVSLIVSIRSCQLANSLKKPTSEVTYMKK